MNMKESVPSHAPHSPAWEPQLYLLPKPGRQAGMGPVELCREWRALAWGAGGGAAEGCGRPAAGHVGLHNFIHFLYNYLALLLLT